jgi:hypothetical protein
MTRSTPGHMKVVTFGASNFARFGDPFSNPF